MSELPIVERLLHTTEVMAQIASVDMQLWDKHSNACLSSATLIRELVEALEPFAACLEEEPEDARDDYDVYPDGLTLEELRRARAAIAKAKQPIGDRDWE